MEVRVATTCLKWSQIVIPQFSPYSKKRSGFITHFNRSSLFGNSSMKLLRFRSCENLKSRGKTLSASSCTASLNNEFSDEEFSKQIQELALKFQLSGDSSDFNQSTDDEDDEDDSSSDDSSSSSNCNQISTHFHQTKIEVVEPSWLGIKPEQPDWVKEEEIIPAIIELKAKSVDIPFSLRIIKKKNHQFQFDEGLREAREFVHCSVKKAFSSMVFIIREIQSYSLQMRENLYYEDLQGILSRVERELNASFVWLFQQVFSQTPTLMVSVMILLANFTVYSMANNTAIAATPSSSSPAAITENIILSENQNQYKSKFDSSSIKTFSVSSSTSVGGNNGGGGKIRFNIAGGTDSNGDGRCDESLSSNLHRWIIPDEISSSSSRVSLIGNKEELKLWNSIMEEASKMQREIRDETLDEETMKRLVSPVTVESEPEDYSDYYKTDTLYQLALSQEPQNPLLLSNYAQFLYLVVHDHDRAEEYFKRAVKVEAPDAEALNRYGSFLWVARNNMGAAEEAFLEAISVDPSNAFYASNYANFLWNTGGEDTCYPLNSSSSSINDA